LAGLFTNVLIYPEVADTGAILKANKNLEVKWIV
jgi:hypothetical protein